MKKHVYLFGNNQAEGSAEMKNLLGGKGANLAEMTNIGITVPPGLDRKSTRLNSSHKPISYAVFCLKKNTRIEC